MSSSAVANIRLNFGCWFSLALEFQLGADIINTTVALSFETLTKLGITALIRTFLNFFLTKELAAEMAVNDQRRDLPSVKAREN